MGELSEANETNKLFVKLICHIPLIVMFEALYNYTVHVIFILVGIKSGVKMLTHMKNKPIAQASDLLTEEAANNPNNFYTKNNIRINMVHC